MEIPELKKQYQSLEKKYKIPSFDKLNEDFEIDKIERESDFLLRVIRKAMMEKIVNSLGFVEMLLNPANAPRLYMAYIRSMSQQDKDSIDKIYDALSELSLSSLALEVEPSEKREAELILKIHEKWNSIKPDFKRIIENMKSPNKNTVAKKEKSYYG